MDSWLAYTLGYPSEVKPEDISVSLTDSLPLMHWLIALDRMHTKLLGSTYHQGNRTFAS